jgi:hypothetical protein
MRHIEEDEVYVKLPYSVTKLNEAMNFSYVYIHIYRVPRRTVSQLKKRSFCVMPTGGIPATIST